MKKTTRQPIKGVILAGGEATRLHPLTHVTNKHLLPVYNKPVIYYAIEKMLGAGIDKIIIITSPQYVGHFVNLLGSGQDFISPNKKGAQIQITYAVQNQPRGIAQALWIARDYVGTDNCILYLGDNIIEDELGDAIKNFTGGATVFLKKVSDPRRFGVATIDAKKNIVRIMEKPRKPESNLAVAGVYLYDNSVFKKLIGQPLSKRGEYEITYINNLYLQEKKLRAVILKKPWFDVGTFDSLLRASNYMQRKNGKKKG